MRPMALRRRHVLPGDRTVIDRSSPPGAPVILRRFGTWKGCATRARQGRNPRTEDAAAIAARRVVRFVVSRTLEQAMAEVGSPAD